VLLQRRLGRGELREVVAIVVGGGPGAPRRGVLLAETVVIGKLRLLLARLLATRQLAAVFRVLRVAFRLCAVGRRLALLVGRPEVGALEERVFRGRARAPG
jgi:hypothetical protein